MEKTEFTTLYQEICGIMLEGEAQEDKISKDAAPELEITFHRNSYFLVKAEDVENLVKSIKKAFM